MFKDEHITKTGGSELWDVVVMYVRIAAPNQHIALMITTIQKQRCAEIAESYVTNLVKMKKRFGAFSPLKLPVHPLLL